MDFLTILSTVTQAPGTTASSAAAATDAATASGGSTMSLLFSAVLYIGFFAIIMYFFIIRPQKKQEKSMQELVSSIRAGDSIVTNSGLYGKVVDVTEGCFIVEFGTSRSIRIPVDKNEVAGRKEPNLTTKKYDEVPAQGEEKK